MNDYSCWCVARQMMVNIDGTISFPFSGVEELAVTTCEHQDTCPKKRQEYIKEDGQHRYVPCMIGLHIQSDHWQKEPQIELKEAE